MWKLGLLLVSCCLFFVGCAKRQVVKPSFQPAKKAVFWPFNNVPVKK